jgi:hypothetical protein
MEPAQNHVKLLGFGICEDTSSDSIARGLYEEESVSRSQMDIKRKSCDIRTWKKHLFLDISSTNTDTLVPSLHECIETCSIEVF